MALDRFKAPPLPNPPPQWDAQYMRQVLRSLEIYFSQLDSRAGNNAESYTAGHFYGNGVGLYFPYNQFLSLVDQTAAAVDEAYPVQLEVTTFNNGISITGVDNTRITFSEVGVYVLTFSLSFRNPVNDAETVNVWLRYNGADVANSNSRFTIPQRKSTGTSSYLVAVTPLAVEVLAVGDYVELVWCTSDTTVVMEYLPAQTYSAGVTPAHPATPSAIVDVTFASRTA